MGLGVVAIGLVVTADLLVTLLDLIGVCRLDSAPHQPLLEPESVPLALCHLHPAGLFRKDRSVVEGCAECGQSVSAFPPSGGARGLGEDGGVAIGGEGAVAGSEESL